MASWAAGPTLRALATDAARDKVVADGPATVSSRLLCRVRTRLPWALPLPLLAAPLLLPPRASEGVLLLRRIPPGRLSCALGTRLRDRRSWASWPGPPRPKNVPARAQNSSAAHSTTEWQIGGTLSVARLGGTASALRTWPCMTAIRLHIARTSVPASPPRPPKLAREPNEFCRDPMRRVGERGGADTSLAAPPASADDDAGPPRVSGAPPPPPPPLSCVTAARMADCLPPTSPHAQQTMRAACTDQICKGGQAIRAHPSPVLHPPVARPSPTRRPPFARPWPTLRPSFAHPSNQRTRSRTQSPSGMCFTRPARSRRAMASAARVWLGDRGISEAAGNTIGGLSSGRRAATSNPPVSRSRTGLR